MVQLRQEDEEQSALRTGIEEQESQLMQQNRQLMELKSAYDKEYIL